MNKNEFLDKLRASLWAMPEADQQRSVDYYAEMIDDRMEDGLSEAEAVAAIGDLDEIVKQILTESPRPPQVVKQTVPKKDNIKVWLIILLIVGSPVWIPLAASAISVVVSVYASLWTVVIALYAVAVAVGAAAIGCFVGMFFMLGRPVTVVVTLGASLLCAGIGILMVLLSNLAAKGMVALTKLCWQGVKSIFQRKEKAV